MLFGRLRPKPLPQKFWAMEEKMQEYEMNNCVTEFLKSITLTFEKHFRQFKSIIYMKKFV